MPPTSGGMIFPYASGQSGTESAASLLVTRAPAISSRTVAAEVAKAKRWRPGASDDSFLAISGIFFREYPSTFWGRDSLVHAAPLDCESRSGNKPTAARSQKTGPAATRSKAKARATATEKAGGLKTAATTSSAEAGTALCCGTRLCKLLMLGLVCWWRCWCGGVEFKVD